MAKKKKKEKSATILCAECGKENLNGAYFCVECGAPLIEAKTPQDFDDLLNDVDFSDEIEAYEESQNEVVTESDEDFDFSELDEFLTLDDLEEEETEEETEEESYENISEDNSEELDLSEFADDFEEEITDTTSEEEIDAQLLGIDEPLEEPDYTNMVLKPVNATIENTVLMTEADEVVFSAPLLAIPSKEITVNREDIDFSDVIIGEKLVICADGDKYRALVAPESEIATLVSAKGDEAEVLKQDYLLRMCDPTLEEKIKAYAYLEEKIDIVHDIFGNKTLSDIYQDDVQKYLNLKDATPELIKTNINDDAVAVLSKLPAEKQNEIAEIIETFEIETVSLTTAMTIVESKGDIKEAKNCLMQDLRITELMKAFMAEKKRPKETQDFYRKCSIY